MNHATSISGFLVLSLAVLGGCSSAPSGNDAKKAAIQLDKIQGRAQVIEETSGPTDAALNAGGTNSIYIWEGVRRYRLFLRKPADVTHGSEYMVEGINAQKAIDDIGDPDMGKHGYPLQASCDHVIRSIWGGMAMDDIDLDTIALRTQVQRHPARPVFLVSKITPVTSDAKKDADDKIPEVSVPADKEKALLVESPASLTAPIWQAEGGTVKCPLQINPEGKVTALDTGVQLCEYAPWGQYRFKPSMEGGHPVKVRTEVEVRYDARK